MKLAEFVKKLLKDSEYHLAMARKAQKDENSNLEQMYVRASIFAAWAAIEGWLNCIAADFLRASDKRVPLHEKALLKQKELILDPTGIFILSERDKYRPLEERLIFILRRFGNYTLDKSRKLWQNFKETKKLRDAITHPKKGEIDSFHVSRGEAERTLKTIKELIRLIMKRIYNQKVSL